MNEIIKSLHEIVAVLKDPKDFWVNITLAISTFIAVIVALFQEKIKKHWNKATLDLRIDLNPPDCHQISLIDLRTGKFVGQSIYIRIKVIHRKGGAGENVEIMPINFFRIKGDGKLEKLKHFLPISLAWSHFQPRTNLSRIPVNLFRHCDFGHFVKDLKDNNKAVLILDTMVQPNPVAESEVPNIIKPGKYQFELLLSGDNVKPIKKEWKLEFDKWSEDEKEMLTKNISIEEI
ncbi:hypothetical protein FJZ40_00235 [Candidatus Shapirobacteria bacterium]|nr:hypothetical protein [Candidatus Shapirobacteria bacterium]